MKSSYFFPEGKNLCRSVFLHLEKEMSSLFSCERLYLFLLTKAVGGVSFL